MGSFVAYMPLSEKVIRSSAKKTLKELKAWFKKNPERKDCSALLWYGKTYSIKRGEEEKMINAAADEAIRSNKKAPAKKTKATKKKK